VHTTQRALLEGSSDAVVESDVPTHTHAKNITHTHGLGESVYTKVMHCKSAKDIWDKLQNIYEGDLKVKAAKLQTYRVQFEQLKMKEDENIVAYFL
jgi:hypothetical protein